MRTRLEIIEDASGAKALEVSREELVVARALGAGGEAVGGHVGAARRDASRRRALAQAHEHIAVHVRTVRDALAVHTQDARYRLARVHERVRCVHERYTEYYTCVSNWEQMPSNGLQRTYPDIGRELHVVLINCHTLSFLENL